MSKKKIKKDNLLETLAGNKLFILFLLILVILAKSLSRTVLNIPSFFIWLKFTIIVGLTITFFTMRIIRHTEFYRKNLKDWSDIVILFFHFVFLGGIFWLTINVAHSFIIITQASNKTETYNCKIVTDFTINEDRIMYSFKGKNYILGINHQQSTSELRNEYYIELYVTKSIFNSYILKSGQLHKKKVDTYINGN